MNEVDSFVGIDTLDCFATGGPAAVLDTGFDTPFDVTTLGGDKHLQENYRAVVPENCPLLVPPSVDTPRTIATFLVCLECPNAALIETGGNVLFPGR